MLLFCVSTINGSPLLPPPLMITCQRQLWKEVRKITTPFTLPLSDSYYLDLLPLAINAIMQRGGVIFLPNLKSYLPIGAMWVPADSFQQRQVGFLLLFSCCPASIGCVYWGLLPECSHPCLISFTLIWWVLASFYSLAGTISQKGIRLSKVCRWQVHDVICLTQGSDMTPQVTLLWPDVYHEVVG